MKKFLDMPPDLLSVLCSEWLDVSDLKILDQTINSTCNSGLFLQKIIPGDIRQVVYHAKKFALFPEQYLNWAKVKSIQFHQLRIGEKNWTHLANPTNASSLLNLQSLHLLPQKPDLQPPFINMMNFPMASLIRFLYLRELTLEYISTPIPSPLSVATPHLEAITLINIDLSENELFFIFDGCPLLKRVRFEDMPRLPTNLGEMAPHLTSLTIINSLASVHYFKDTLEKCSKVTQLQLHMHRDYSSMENWLVYTLASKVGLLEVLSLRGQTEFEDSVFAHYLNNHGLALHTLELHDIPRISNSTALAVSKIPNMCKLVLCGSNVTDLGAQYILSACKKIKHLDFSYCSEISDIALGLLSGHSLLHLNVEFCARVTNNGIKSVLHACPSLQYLNISGAGVYPSGGESLITDEALHSMIMYGQNLSHVVLGRNLSFSMQAITRLLESGGRLYTVELVNIRHLVLAQVRRSKVRQLVLRRCDFVDLDSTPFSSAFPFLRELHLPQTSFYSYRTNHNFLFNQIRHLEVLEFAPVSVTNTQQLADIHSLASNVGFEYDEYTHSFRR